jgi:hypothetical protein
MPFVSDPGDGLRRVAVALLRLRYADESFARITLEVGSEANEEDIWTRSREWFEDFNPLDRADWSVTQASLRIEFYPENEGGPAKVITVDLRRMVQTSRTCRAATRRSLRGTSYVGAS